MLDKKLWEFKYSPTEFDKIILNEEIKPKLKKAIEELPNILLYGTPGVGKGCFTNVFLKETGCDSMWINASDETGIDVIREKIKPFAFAMSGNMKVVVLNEADSLSQGLQGAQKMLRQLMEDCQNICRFIFLCNYENNIIPELKSRCQVIKVDNPPKKQIGILCLKILKKEKIKYKPETIKDIIEKCYPDIRKTINVLQENCIDGKLTGSRISSSESVWDEILKGVIDGDIELVREIIKSNYIDYPSLYEHFYNNAGEFKQPGLAIILIGEHLYKDAIVSIKEINFMTMVVRMLQERVI